MLRKPSNKKKNWKINKRDSNSKIVKASQKVAKMSHLPKMKTTILKILIMKGQ